MKVLILAIAIALTGCASQPNSTFSEMSPEQLRAIHADKNITIVCSSVDTLTTNIVNVYAVIDKTTIPQGGLTIEGRVCGINLVTSSK